MNSEQCENKLAPRGVIPNCCFNCDEETTNKITVNKGKKNEREDFLCELCIIDINKMNKKECENIIKPRGVIPNSCFNCDEKTTNKIIMNKGRKNEREDYLCELCVLDSIKNPYKF